MKTLPRIDWQSRFGDIVAICAFGSFAGAFVGATTNAINALVSPRYFITIMWWPADEHVWATAIAQGILEGSIAGLLFSFCFIDGLAIITRTICSLHFFLKHLLGIVAAIYVAWNLGGLIAMGLATAIPELYRSMFIGVPGEFSEMLRYAWVGGSIWGAHFGGVICFILFLIYITRKLPAPTQD